MKKSLEKRERCDELQREYIILYIVTVTGVVSVCVAGPDSPYAERRTDRQTGTISDRRRTRVSVAPALGPLSLLPAALLPL